MLQEFSVRLQKRFGKLYSVSPYSRMIVFQRCLNVCRVKSVKPMKRPQSVQSPSRLRTVNQQLCDCPDNVGVLSFPQQPLSRIAVPGIRRRQLSDQTCRIESTQILYSVPLYFRAQQSIDATSIMPAGEVAEAFDFFGNGMRMLNRFAVHIKNVNAAVGSVHEVHRAKPVVR